MKKSKILLCLGFFVFLAGCDRVKLSEPREIDFDSFGVSPYSDTSIGGYSITERMEHYNVPGVSIAVVENGELDWAKGFGIANSTTGQKVETNTLFQAASLSKPISALAILILLENNKIALDENVNVYLDDWKVPDSKFTSEEKVTLRRLLNHTAGITVSGFPGYREQDGFPEIQDVLNGEGNTNRILVDEIPGSVWRYSGGGYTIVQKVVEDISGLSFQEYMDTFILAPLKMTSSTYQQPLPLALHAQASAAYYSNGKIIDGLWNNYPERAAAGLWTTPTDLAKYVIKIQDIHSGKSIDFLSKDTVDLMLTMHKNGWGLGPSLGRVDNSLIFQHSGRNAGFTSTMLAFVSPKNSVIIMTNGDNGGNLIQEIENSILKHYGW